MVRDVAADTPGHVRDHDVLAATRLDVDSPRLTGIEPHTLRLRVSKGMITAGRTSGGARRGSDRDIQRLLRIAALARAGLHPHRPGTASLGFDEETQRPATIRPRRSRRAVNRDRPPADRPRCARCGSTGGDSGGPFSSGAARGGRDVVVEVEEVV